MCHCTGQDRRSPHSCSRLSWGLDLYAGGTAQPFLAPVETGEHSSRTGFAELGRWAACPWAPCRCLQSRACPSRGIALQGNCLRAEEVTSYSKTIWRLPGKVPPSCLSGLVSRDAGVLSLALKGAEQSGHLMFVIPSMGNWMLWALYIWTWVAVRLISQEGVGCLSGDSPADLFHS